MKNLLLFSYILFSTFTFAQAQNYRVSAVYVVSGGNFNDGENSYTKLQRYQPSKDELKVLDSAKGSFNNVLEVRNDTIYYSASDQLIQYSSISGSRTKDVSITGAVDIGFRNDSLLIVKGFGASSNFLELYDAKTLSSLSPVAAVDDEASGITTFGDSAYIAVPGIFGSTTGSIYVVHIPTLQVVRKINLGTTGARIGRFYESSIIRVAFAEQNKQLIRLNVANGKVSTFSLPQVTRVYGISDDKLVVQTGQTLRLLDINTQVVEDTLVVVDSLQGVVASVQYDSTTASTYVATSDFNTFGRLYLIQDKKIMGQWEIGVAPERMHIVYTNAVGIAEQRAQQQLSAYPNPTTAGITLELPLEKGILKLYTMSGQEVLVTNMSGGRTTLSLEGLQPGAYLTTYTTATQSKVARILLK